MCKGVDGLLRDAARSSETGPRHGHEDPEKDRGLGFKLRRSALRSDRGVDLRQRRNQLHLLGASHTRAPPACFPSLPLPFFPLPVLLAPPLPLDPSSARTFASLSLKASPPSSYTVFEHRVAPLASVVVVVVVGGEVPHTCRSCRHGSACRGSPPACPSMRGDLLWEKY